MKIQLLHLLLESTEYMRRHFLEGVKNDLSIMFMIPYTFISRINDTSKHFGLNAKTKNELMNRIQKVTKEGLSQLDMVILVK
jgi:hypothetical protein